jgi:hypothetical protein
MSKKIFEIVRELKIHTQDLQSNLRAVVENNRLLAEYVGKPKYDVIMQALPIFESKVKYHKSQVQMLARELSHQKFIMSDDFDDWLS